MDIETKSMKVIIFGAAGTIGNYLAKRYLKDNHEILLFVKNQKSKNRLIKSLNLEKKNIIIDYLNIEKNDSVKKKLINIYSFLKNLD